jgi:hypothetical protein
MPGSKCSLMCESFLPQGQSSVEICETVGTLNYLNTKNEYDMAGNFPQSSRLNPISPLYLDRCPETCDAKNLTPDALTPDDKVLNKCIENGLCTTVLSDLAYNVVKNNIPVTNPAFKKFIDYAKLNQPINPNIAAKIAQSGGIPPSVAIDILKTAQYGTTDEGSPSDLLSKGVITPDTAQAVMTVPRIIEPIVIVPVNDNYDGDNGYDIGNDMNKKIVMSILIFLFLVLIGLFISQSCEKK